MKPLLFLAMSATGIMVGYGSHPWLWLVAALALAYFRGVVNAGRNVSDYRNLSDEVFIAKAREVNYRTFLSMIFVAVLAGIGWLIAR